jgi:hypothetical protein
MLPFVSDVERGEDAPHRCGGGIDALVGVYRA